MGDSVERALEETVPVLQAARRAKLLSPQEIYEVVRKRRNHEYALKKQRATRSEYLKYASFERELANLLQKRAEKRKIKKKTTQLIVGKTSSRVNLIYSRATKAFHGDVDLWLHYARHCIKTGTIRTAQKVLGRAIAYRGDSERVWLAAVALHFDTCGDAKGARTLAQRALRAIPQSALMWKEYFRLEVCYLSKLLIRRLAIGLPPGSPKSKEQVKPLQFFNATESVNGPASKELFAGDSGVAEERTHRQSEEIDNGEKPIAGEHTEENDDEEDSDTSESEASDTKSTGESSSTASDSAPCEDSEDLNKGIESTERLSFWDGGVPMTVFRRACDNAILTTETLFQFWSIAVSSPYVPPLLLNVMSQHISKRFPTLIISRLIEARLEWDCARTECQRKTDAKSRIDTLRVGAPAEGHTVGSRQAQDEATKLPSRFEDILRNEEIETWSFSERKASLACMRDVQVRLQKIASSRNLASKLESLVNLLDCEKQNIKTVIPNVIRDEGDKGECNELNHDHWSIPMLEQAIAQGKTDEGMWKYGDVLSAVKQKASVPFRDVYQDKVVAQYLATETDIEAIREVSDILLATPPLPNEILRCIIEAEMKVIEASALSSYAGVSEETKIRLRKLFAKLESTPKARHDVEFWLLFLDFERRRLKDAKTASAVHAKALRILTQDNVALFTELQTLRNLT